MASQPPVLTDDDIMRVRAQSAPAPHASAPQQPYTIGRVDPMRVRAEERSQAAAERAARADERAATAAERAAANVPAGYRQAQGGGLEPIPGGPADPNRVQPTTGSARMRQLPNTQIQRLNDGSSSLANLQRALTNFQDNYGGNLLGGVENTLQGINGSIGTPGQNQFWSDVAATDNVARNALFGASLTEGEKAAWEATTIRPSMDPAIIRQNLTRRVGIARAALTRLARTNAANGFNPEAIQEALGDARGLLGVDYTPAEGRQPHLAPGLDAAGQANAGADFAQQIGGAPAGSEERFRMLEQYHQFRTQNPQIGRVGSFDATGAPTDLVDEMGVSEDQGNRLLQEYQDQLPTHEARQRREQFATDHPILAGADTVVRSAANAMTLGYADRLAGGDPFLTDANPQGVAQQHAVTASDWENRPVLAFGGTLAGGSVLPLGGENALRQMATAGAYGGGYGYLSSDGTQGERVQNALLGAATGAGAAGLVNAGMRVAGRGGGGGNPSNVELVQAARRQNVDLMPADLGNPMTARATAGVRQTLGGAGPVARGAQRTEAQVGRRLSQVARAEGAPARQEVLGDVARNALENYNASSGEYGRNLYANARDLADGAHIQGSRATAVLQRDLAELQATKNTDAPLISGLERLQADIAPNGTPARLTVDQMRRLRTTVRSEAQTDALRATDYQRRAKGVLDALSEDISSQLPPAAAREFRAADQAWAERLNFIDDVENHVLGPKNNRSAEGVAQRLLNMSRSDSSRFVRVLDTVSPEESSMIRGSAIEELGRARGSSPNAGGFSLDTFLTNYQALPARTRAVLFRGQSRQDVEDLAAIALARRGANQSANVSGTAGAVNVNSALHTASTLGAYSSLGISTLLENMTGRMLASPRLVRLAARPPQDPGKLLRGLQRIAVAEPAIRNNLDTIIQAVQRSGQNLEPALRAAATPQDQRQDGR
ncbi:MAG: hypothetical protein V4527_18390 [Pseudomonadota bacterium]